MTARPRRGILLCAVAVGTWLAAPAPAASQLSPEGGPIAIEADQGRLDTVNSSVTYSGNVSVTQGNSRLAADQITIEYTETPSATSTTGGIARILAQGDVRYATPDEKVSAGRGLYEAQRNTLTLEDDVILINSDGQARGARMVVSLDQGEWTLSGSSSSRVKTVIRSDSR